MAGWSNYEKINETKNVGKFAFLSLWLRAFGQWRRHPNLKVYLSFHSSFSDYFSILIANENGIFFCGASSAGLWFILIILFNLIFWGKFDFSFM
jgi:hypothetical protein